MKRSLLRPSMKMVALPVLLIFIFVAFCPKAVTVHATTTIDNDQIGSIHRMLRWKNDDSRFTSSTSKRLLQSYTNETTDYEDGPAVNQDRVVDFEYCYGALQRADDNIDGRIEKSEYLHFVQDFGENTECLGDLLSLPAMPIELTACWNQLSCSCRVRGGAPDCCSEENANLPLNGVNAVYPAPSEQTKPQPPEEVYIEDEQKFLSQTCLRTDQCIIAFCGYPSPPVVPIVPVPTIPPTLLVPEEKETEENKLNLLWLLFLLPLLCCCRRRWILCPAGKADEDSDDEEENNDAEQAPIVPIPGDPTVMRSIPVDNEDDLALIPSVENVLDDFEGNFSDPDANRVAMKSMAASELGEGGGVRYYRVVKEPEYEEDPPPPEPKVIDQYDKDLPTGDGIKLKHIEKEQPPPPEEDPYALEHYEPDGGIVEHKRTGEWGYKADGGYTPGETTSREQSDWKNPGYNRAVAAAVVITDDRRDRNLDRYGGGAIFDHLDETDEPASKGVGNDPLQWVFSKTLNTLDDNQDDLVSEPSTSKRSLQD